MKPRRRQGDRGAALVEAAFALPIFFMLVLGMIDFGLVGFKDNQAGNAARDGARVAVIGYRQADVSGSPDRLAVEAAIVKNLPGRSIPGDTTVEVKCIDPDGVDVVGGCTAARIGIDRVWVRVSWTQHFASPVANALGFTSTTVDGESAMVIVGAPVPGGGVPPTPCDVTSVSVTPDPAIREVNGELSTDLTIEVQATGGCGNLNVTLEQGSLSELVCTGPSCTGTLIYPADQTDDWSTGPVSVLVTGDDTHTGSFTIIDTTVCAITGVSVSPATVERYTTGTRQNELAEDLIVSVSRTGICSNLTVTLITPDGGTTRTLCAGSTCETAGYSSAGDPIWTIAGTASIEVTGEDTGSTTFTVTDAPPTCSASVSVGHDPATALRNETDLANPTSVQITVVASGPCATFDITLVASDGATTYNVCTGCAAGTYPYDPPAGEKGAKPWRREQRATVNVAGSATASTTFLVN